MDTLSNRLSMLNAVSFKLKSKNQMPLNVSSEDTDTHTTGIEDRTRYGFLAQEVNAVYPELVHTDSIGYMYVDYLGMIPLLVDAVNSLQARTDSLSNVIEELKSVENPVQRARQCDDRDKGPDMPGMSEVVLYQNLPNPFSAETEIRCLLPDNARLADLYVYDLQGVQKKKYEIHGRGQTSVVIRGTELSAGMYIYSLIVDGMEIDSKRMILTD